MGLRRDTMGVVRPASDNPKNGILRIDQKKLTLLVEKAELMVGEIVAQELRAMRHAKGLEAVAFTPRAKPQGLHHGVGIEDGCVPRQPTGVEAFGTRSKREGERGQSLLQALFGGDEEHPAVEHGDVRGREETAARMRGMKYIGDLGHVEAVGTQQFEKQLREGSLRKPQRIGSRKANTDAAILMVGEQPAAEGLKEGMIELFDRLEVLHGLLKAAVGSRLEFPQQGHDLVADLIAAIVERGIGHIFDMGKALLCGIALYLVAAKGQQGADDVTLHRQDAVKARKTRATKEVEEEGLGRIVSVMGRENGRIALLGHDLLEESVAELPRSVLDAEFVLVSVGKGVEPGKMEGDVVALGHVPDKALVAIAVAWAQREVAMSYGKRIARGIHEMRQDGGIHPPTNGKQHLLPRREEVLLLRVC